MDIEYSDPQEAIAQLERALGAAREARANARGKAQRTEARHREGQMLGKLGNAYRAHGEVRRAIACYEEGLGIARELRAAACDDTARTDARRTEGAHAANLGNAYSDVGEMGKAIAYYQQAIAIARELRAAAGSEAERTAAWRREGADLGNLGTAYSALGRVEKAIACYEEALRIARDTRDRQHEGIWLGNLGTAFSDLGEIGKAIGYYEEALAIAREMGAASGSAAERTEARRGEGNRLGSLGNAYSALGQTAQAIACYEEAIAIARETGDRGAEASHSWNLGDELAETDPARAAALMQVCVDYERAIGHPDAAGDAARVEALRRRATRPWWQFWGR